MKDALDAICNSGDLLGQMVILVTVLCESDASLASNLSALGDLDVCFIFVNKAILFGVF